MATPTNFQLLQAGIQEVVDEISIRMGKESADTMKGITHPSFKSCPFALPYALIETDPDMMAHTLYIWFDHTLNNQDKQAQDFHNLCIEFHKEDPNPDNTPDFSSGWSRLVLRLVHIED
jgi:hypothetical protein